MKEVQKYGSRIKNKKNIIHKTYSSFHLLMCECHLHDYPRHSIKHSFDPCLETNHYHYYV